MTRTVPCSPHRPIDPAGASDPVAAVLSAIRSGATLRLRTSGSSGSARAVLRTPQSWVDSFTHVARLTDLRAGSRVWLPGPLQATMNLFAAVCAAQLGARVQQGPEAATHAHLTPRALREALHSRVGLTGVRVTVAGERLPPVLGAQAEAAGAVVSHYYGAAELSFVAWGRHADDLSLFPGVEVEVRSSQIWVRSPYLCLGYDGAPGMLKRDARGFVSVGDRGRWDGARLRIDGRQDGRVVTAAATVLIDDVERVLHRAALGDLGVLGVPHGDLGEVVAAVLTDEGDLRAVRGAAAARLEPAQRPRWWFHARQLPLTSTGKLDRAALRRAIEAGELRRLTPGVTREEP